MTVQETRIWMAATCLTLSVSAAFVGHLVGRTLSQPLISKSFGEGKFIRNKLNPNIQGLVLKLHGDGTADLVWKVSDTQPQARGDNMPLIEWEPE